MVGFRVRGEEGQGEAHVAPTFRVDNFSGFRVEGAGAGFWDLKFRVQGSGFRVQGSGFRVQDSGFRGQVLGFRV